MCNIRDMKRETKAQSRGRGRGVNVQESARLCSDCSLFENTNWTRNVCTPVFTVCAYRLVYNDAFKL